MQRSRPRYLELLEHLSREEVDFIVVGGVAAILEGAPITTLDLDIVYDCAPANLERLLIVLQKLDATYRDLAGRIIQPDLGRLTTLRTHLLETDLGPLDLLTSIGDEAAYADLSPWVRIYEIEGMEIQVLGLAKVIETKEFANRDKDRAVLPVLRKTLELKED